MRSITKYTNPYDKEICLRNAFGILNLFCYSTFGYDFGADIISDLVLFVLIYSQVPLLNAQLEYLDTYRIKDLNNDDMGYMIFTVLQMASFISMCDSSNFSDVSKETWCQYMGDQEYIETLKERAVVADTTIHIDKQYQDFINKLYTFSPSAYPSELESDTIQDQDDIIEQMKATIHPLISKKKFYMKRMNVTNCMNCLVPPISLPQVQLSDIERKELIVCVSGAFHCLEGMVPISKSILQPRHIQNVRSGMEGNV